MALEILLGVWLQTAVVRGRVLAKETGEPVPHAHVFFRCRSAEGNDVSATTDGAGKFEIRDIEPGTYAPIAVKPGFISTESAVLVMTAGQMEDHWDFHLPRAAVIAGTVLDADGDPVINASVKAMVKLYRQGHVEWQERGKVETDDHGDYRLHDLPAGRYYIQAGKEGYAVNGRPGPTPFSTARRAEALTVTAGEERRGIDFRLHAAETHTISGKVVDSAGKPIPQMMVRAHLVDEKEAFNYMSFTREDGTFEISNLPPGEYLLWSSLGPQFTRELEIASADISNLTIRVGPGATIKGKIRAEGGELPAKVVVSLKARSETRGSAVIGTDGTFEIAHVQPGKYELEITPYQVTAATVGGQDALDVPFTVAEDATTMEVSATIDVRTATITGHTLDADGNPLPNTSVALIPADPKRRALDRYRRTTQSGADAAFRLANVIPGDYFLAIWPGDDASPVFDLEVFAALESHVISITVRRSASITQDLRISKELNTIAEPFLIK